jgi:hypothetical protein
MHREGGDAQGGRGDARASCASPLGTPLVWRATIEPPRLLIFSHHLFFADFEHRAFFYIDIVFRQWKNCIFGVADLEHIYVFK